MYATTIEKSQNLWATRSLVAALLPTLEWRWHGIGVLQAYVREGSERELRVHLWSRELMLPGISESCNAHNHRFTLRSTLLLGELLHTEWNVEPGTGYSLYDFVHARLQTDENSSAMRLLPGEVSVQRVPILLRTGDTYTFQRGAYHDSCPTTDIALTLVEKLDQIEEKARVIAPTHTPPVPAFGGGSLPADLVIKLVSTAIKRLHEATV